MGTVEADLADVAEGDVRSRSAGFFDGHYGRLLLPGVILQSVLIGGGYATGREIVQFGAKFGALGWIAAFTEPGDPRHARQREPV